MKQEMFDTRRWPALGWATAAAILSGMAALHEKLERPALLTGLALAVATLIAALADRVFARPPTSSHRGSSGPDASEATEGVGARPTAQPQGFDDKLLSEARAHREWLHSSLQTVAWAGGIVLTAGLGLAVWILGDSASSAASTAVARALDEEKARSRLQRILQETLDAERKTMPDRVRAEADAALEDVLKKKLQSITGVNAESIIRDVFERRADSITPIGSVVAWPTDVRAPVGWLACEGQALDGDEYPALYNLLTGLYGARDPKKVTLPDVRSYFLRGAGGLAAPVGQPQAESVAAHTHAGVIRLGRHDKGPVRSTHTIAETSRWDATGDNTSQITDPWGGEETRPRNYAVHWIIRVK